MTTYGVFFRMARLGLLESDRGRLRFSYEPEAVDDGEPTLSVRLPPRLDPYQHDDAEPFFANLLPEDEYRQLLARILQLSDRNVAGLLGAIGGECAGAVSVWPKDSEPTDPPAYVPLGNTEFEELLGAADAAQRLTIVQEGRLSLAGTMEKLGLRKRGGRWERGRNGSPTTHILKWPQARFPDQSYNELFCLELWRDAGLPVPDDVEVLGISSPVIVVKRYDRREREDGGITLVHQEDFLQATGRDVRLKYEGEGGPSLQDCATVIREHCAVPARGIQLLLRWAIGNFLTGNGDGHGKNIALLHDPGEGVMLTPFYDITCSQAYRGLHRKLAMSVGGEYRFEYIRARHWEGLAAGLGIPFAGLRRDGLDLAERFAGALGPTRDRLATRYGDQPIFDTVRNIVIKHIALLRSELSSTIVPGGKKRNGA